MEALKHLNINSKKVEEALTNLTAKLYRKIKKKKKHTENSLNSSFLPQQQTTTCRKLVQRIRIMQKDTTTKANTNATSNSPPIQLKPTDITISPDLLSQFPDKVKLYQELQSRERSLDLMINKKLLDIQDYQQQLASSQLVDNGLNSDGWDTLRIFIYNTSENQPWQEQKTGTGEPSWTLRIEGRLLNDNEPLESPNRRKMSSFLSGLSVELKAADGNDESLVLKPVSSPGSAGTNAKLVEWHFNPSLPESERLNKQFDGMDIKRGGVSIKNGVDDEREVIANVVIQPRTFPIKLKIVNDALIELVGEKEITQSECIRRIFWYAKVNGLFEIQNIDQDGEKSSVISTNNIVTNNNNITDKNTGQKIIAIKADELLYKIFAISSITMPQVMEMVGGKLLKPIDPVRIQYHVNTLKNTTIGEIVLDIRVNKGILEGKKSGQNELEDLGKLLNEQILDKKSMNDLIRLDENLKLNLQLLNYSKMKYDFYKNLSENPAQFLEQILDKNEEYLKILSSDSMSFGKDGMIDEEVVRKSGFYDDEFLRQHINLLLNSGRI